MWLAKFSDNSTCWEAFNTLRPGQNGRQFPDRRQEIIWTNAGILLIGPLGTNVSEIWIKILIIFVHENASENVVRKVEAILARPQCVISLPPKYSANHILLDWLNLKNRCFLTTALYMR